LYPEDGGDEKIALQSFISITVVTIRTRRRKTERSKCCAVIFGD